jgi:CelD/BcsL family acetyltransferase involved in cellulose biosynthesis
MSSAAPPAPTEAPTVEVHREIRAIAEEWDALASAVRADPFCRPGWIAAWREAFGRGELEVLALRGAGGLEAVLPLERHGAVLGATANSHSFRFDLVAVDRDRAIELVRAAIARTPRRLELSELDAEGAAAGALEALAAEGGHAIDMRVLRHPPRVRLAADSDVDSVVRRGDARRQLRRRRRRLSELGDLQFDRQDGIRELERFLDEGLALEGSGWKRDAGTAIESDATTARFYRDMARWAAARGMLRLDFLRLDGRAIAFYLSLADPIAGTIHVLKGGFDREFEEYSPGRLLFAELFVHSGSEGLSLAELHGDDARYKRDFTIERGLALRAQAFAPTARGRLEHLEHSFARPAARRIWGHRAKANGGRKP